MAISSTVIISNNNKTNVIDAIDSACGYPEEFSFANTTFYELTNGTETYWAMSGWFDERGLQAIINNNHVHHVVFPADLEEALESASLTQV